MPACSRCGRGLDSVEVLYDETAQVVCSPCVTAAQVRAGHAKSATTARSAAYGNLAIGLASFVFNPFFALSIASLGNAVFVFRRIRDDQQRGELIPDERYRKVVVVIGAMLGAGALLLRFV